MPKIEWEISECGECDSLEDLPKNAHPIKIDGVAVVGECLHCFEPVLISEEYYSGYEGDYILCQDCCKEEMQ